MPPPLHCAVSEEMIEDAKSALDERVTVAGTVKRDELGKVILLKVKTLEISFDEGEAGT